MAPTARPAGKTRLSGKTRRAAAASALRPPFQPLLLILLSLLLLPAAQIVSCAAAAAAPGPPRLVVPMNASVVPVLLQLQNTLELVQYNWAGAGDCVVGGETGGAAEPFPPIRGRAGAGAAGWAGVTCDGHGNPTRLEFPQQGLTGHLPADVSTLTSLTKINLQRNLIIERLDVFIKPLEGLTNLQHLDLSSNFLFGSIPPTITAFPRLTVLSLSSNRLTGRVPPRLSPLLSTFSLSSNYLSGPLPRTPSSAPSLPPPSTASLSKTLPPALPTKPAGQSRPSLAQARLCWTWPRFWSSSGRSSSVGRLCVGG
ncbi:hypothetical protein CLOM_g9603 [Closterium sp. NIES-68]|nr:hypothetical protein CLOM_g9603 [Closterium sp. NIES-68]GJP64277.1 hypothetical protein CLOP_g21291 [Closterium sp. NIES-67]